MPAPAGQGHCFCAVSDCDAQPAGQRGIENFAKPNRGIYTILSLTNQLTILLFYLVVQSELTRRTAQPAGQTVLFFQVPPRRFELRS
jgi:hypothetical protein